MGVPIIGLPKRTCLQCGVEYQPRSEKHVICDRCIRALSQMSDAEQAFHASMARRIADLEDRVNRLEDPKKRLMRN